MQLSIYMKVDINMEYNGRTHISKMYTKANFIELNLNMDSSDRDWDSGIDMFIDRINGRYLNVISKIRENDYLYNDGFAIMALNCLLIETFLQFKKGWNETEDANKEKYSRFLIEEFPEVFINITLARCFYSNIRCGILHSAQTKKGSQLTTRNQYIVRRIDNNRISVDVIGISNIINDYFERYVENIRNRENIELRNNFLKKMNFICNM